MLKWLCDSCGNEVEREPENFRVTVPTAEGPVTVLLSAGYGKPELNPEFNPQSSGAVVCKRCVYLQMQSEFALEEAAQAGHPGPPTVVPKTASVAKKPEA